MSNWLTSFFTRKKSTEEATWDKWADSQAKPVTKTVVLTIQFKNKFCSYYTFKATSDVPDKELLDTWRQFEEWFASPVEDTFVIFYSSGKTGIKYDEISVYSIEIKTS